jgi:Zn-dependent peptidase ImmA (M78 family)
VKNIQLGIKTVEDIDAQVDKILRGLGLPEPPLDLRLVREILNLDRVYYSTTDDSVLRETISRLKVAGVQVLRRPMLLAEAIRSWNLKALYLPDQKRILIDQTLPEIKHRWNEAHEIGHDIVPWHAGMMLGDNEQTLSIACRAQLEAEANFAAGRLLFLANRFIEEANACPPAMSHVRALSKRFGNTITSTLWRFVEQSHVTIPMIALVSGHPHPSKWKDDFDPAVPCRYCIESPRFLERFGAVLEVQLFQAVTAYCGAQRGGELGTADLILLDRNRESHVFRFETFFNGHDALTLGVWQRPATRLISAGG